MHLWEFCTFELLWNGRFIFIMQLYARNIYLSVILVKYIMEFVFWQASCM